VVLAVAVEQVQLALTAQVLLAGLAVLVQHLLLRVHP
jgi:hypothetical protein